MSYTSDNEDYYDAFDITPLQSKSSLESSYGQTLTEISAKESASAHPLNKEKICKELSFDSKTSIITSYDTPLESDPSKTKCSVVILEPDIVQSTKSSSLPRQQLPTSTVTPRKKKSKSADIPLYNPEDLPASDKTHCLMAEEEENGSVTPKMPECSSPVLDITSATKGSCLVSLCDQVHPERSRRDSHESWDSVQSKDLSSTEDLLSTDHILDEEDEEEDANVYPDKNEQEGLPVDDDIDDTTRQASFSPTTFSTPLSSFSSHFTSAMSVSSTSTPDKLHSFATQENLHCTEFLSRAHHKGSRKSHLGRTCSNKATPPSLPLTTPSEKSQAARKDDLVEDKETTHDDEEDNEDEDNEDEEDDDDEIKENDKPSRLSDQEILNKTMVLNLDTGETVPLSSAEEKLPKCINPLSLHIMRRTKEYSSSDSNLHKQDVSDNDTAKVTQRKKSKPSSKKRMRIKQFFGKTVNRFKSVAEKNTHTDDTSTDDDDIVEHRKSIKIKHSHSHKGPYDFELLVPIQEIGDNKSGAVWTMKFSPCGRLLATGGQDALLRVWVLQDALQFFTDMRNKYNDVGRSTLRSNTSTDHETFPQSPEGDTDQSFFPFHRHPFSTYKGHTADVLDISWSKNYFLLSSSMDKTVRLWHASRFECLCCFQHIDFVTAISFHPKDDRYFLSGSLDGKLRLWNIPDKKVALWNEVVGGPVKLITAANFCLNGRFAVVGTYDGRCIFYNSEHLKYFTQIQVRSTRGRNKRGRKITGVEPFPGDNKILVTSNDSRIRLYDLRDLTLTCKYKGVTNNTSQIKASFSHDGRYVVCGSEDHFIYSWKTQHEFYKFSSARKDRNNYWEGIKAHPAVVTNAIFSPDPEAIIKPNFEFIDSEDKASHTGSKGEVIVSADFLGSIRIFVNKFKPPA